MYSVSVPLVRFYENYEDNINEAKKLDAKRIFFCPCRATSSEEERALALERIKHSLPVYEEAGFEVGVWISTMGHGGPLVGVPSDADSGFTPITGVHGVTTSDSYCPLDRRFSSAVCDYLKEIAKTGVRMIMLDDDFRFSHRGDCGCTCRHHMAEFEKRLGERISREEVFEKVFTGGNNRYRQIYYDMLGDTLRDFAVQMRAAIDEINPEIRFSFCAVTSSWDCDGTDAIELAEIMAGKTKPFLRFIGAPYWSAGDGHVQYVAELERMQAKWCRDKGIEILGEGDTYPRPRYKVPSSYLEIFDTVLRADGSFDGILKYGIDYVSTPKYETGYADRAMKNRPLYREIENRFADKKSVGINVTCEMKKMLNTVFTEPEKQIGSAYDSAFYQSEQYFLTGVSVPMTYEDAPVTVAFGENGKYINMNCKGFIIDAVSAMHLNNAGIDTGVEPCFDGKKYSISTEEFLPEGETVSSSASDSAVFMKIKQGAQIISEFVCDDGKTKIPACVRYENNNGQRFLIYGYDFDRVRQSSGLARNYMRQEQLVREYEWLAEEKLPAVCRKNPDLYIMAKKGEESMSVGLWNVFPDEIVSPVIELDRVYSRVEFINCSGRLEGERVVLDTDIPAYKFAGFEVYY